MEQRSIPLPKGELFRAQSNPPNHDEFPGLSMSQDIGKLRSQWFLMAIHHVKGGRLVGVQNIENRHPNGPNGFGQNTQPQLMIQSLKRCRNWMGLDGIIMNHPKMARN